MNKQQLSIIIALLVLIIGGSSIYVYNNFLKSEVAPNNIVEIVQDGKILQRIDLHKIDKAQLITVGYQGHYNKIQIEQDKIQIIDADCPDKLCVKMGYLKHNAPPLVCLPHHLVIQYADSSLDTNAN